LAIKLKDEILSWFEMSKENKIPVPHRTLSSFDVGQEVRHLGIAHRTDDCHFEVIDPQKAKVRSLMTGEDLIFEEGYFIRIQDVPNLPPAVDLQEAQRGERYCSLLDGKEYQILSTDEHTIRLLEIDSGQIRVHSKIGSEIFYKVNKEEPDLPMDDDGQFLLFEL
jgi:hypothetical protein